jgi:hypothetical protein
MTRIEKLLEYETAGDPMRRLKWTRKTLRKIAAELGSLGIPLCANTVGRLLGEMGYSLRVNRKAMASSSAADRNEQMLHIAKLRTRFTRAGQPVVSADSKKKSW